MAGQLRCRRRGRRSGLGESYNLEMLSLDAVDVDGDAADELVLGLAIGRPDLPYGARNRRSIAFKATDGAVVFDVTRALTRSTRRCLRTVRQGSPDHMTEPKAGPFRPRTRGEPIHAGVTAR